MLKQRGCSYTIVVFFQMIMCMLKINKIVNTYAPNKSSLTSSFLTATFPWWQRPETTVEPPSSLTFKVWLIELSSFHLVSHSSRLSREMIQLVVHLTDLLFNVVTFICLWEIEDLFLSLNILHNLVETCFGTTMSHESHSKVLAE